MKKPYVSPRVCAVMLVSLELMVGHTKDLHDNGSGGTEGGIGDGEYDDWFGVKQTNLWDDEW